MSQERRHRIFASSGGQAFDLAPLIDVLFLLLVFFLVATTFERRESGLPLQLPAAEAGEELPEERPLRIEVTSDAVSVDGRRVDARELPSTLAAAPGRPVIIASDRLVPYERFVAVLDATRKAGVVSVTLEAERSRPPE